MLAYIYLHPVDDTYAIRGTKATILGDSWSEPTHHRQGFGSFVVSDGGVLQALE